jgi:hypothetical protein
MMESSTYNDPTPMSFKDKRASRWSQRNLFAAPPPPPSQMAAPKTSSTSTTPTKPRSKKGIFDSGSDSGLDASGHSGASASQDLSSHSLGGPRGFFRNAKPSSFRAKKLAKEQTDAQRRLTSQLSFSDAEKFSFAADDSWLEFCEDLTLDETK